MTFEIIVIGSKPEILIPKFKYKKIYTANGGVSRGAELKANLQQAKLISVVGGRLFIGNENIKNRVVKAIPDCIHVRGAKIKKEDFFSYEVIFNDTTNSEQINFQKQFFKNGIISIFLGEFFLKQNFYKKFLHFLRCIFRGKLMGVGTGFYSILMALHENPNSDIMISGIGMSGGKWYFDDEITKTHDYSSRARVDRYLIKTLKKKFKDRLYTQDKELSETTGISFFSF